jgi:hypothetical protein
MAYFIFLKYLRSLEEFMKNPHIKIPPKSPTNFQSLCRFKNLFFIWKRIFLHFQPNRPSGQPTQPRPTCFFNRPLPLSPLGLDLSAGPAIPRVCGALPGCRLPHGEAPPAALPLPSLRARLTGGPHLSSLTSSPPELSRAATTSRCSPHRLRPPHAARPLGLRRQSKPLLPLLDSPS